MQNKFRVILLLIGQSLISITTSEWTSNYTSMNGSLYLTNYTELIDQTPSLSSPYYSRSIDERLDLFENSMGILMEKIDYISDVNKKNIENDPKKYRDDKLNHVLRKIESMQRRLDRIEHLQYTSQFGGYPANNETDPRSYSLRKLDRHINLSVLERTITTIDNRTQTLSTYFNELITCCRSTESELMTFTNSADVILKRLEKFAIRLKDDIISTTPSVDDNDLNNQYVEFSEPLKTGCHQVTKRIDGIYIFEIGNLTTNEKQSFGRRFCDFSTEGLGWTVIQRRGLYDRHENFNRSWYDYKWGFGNIAEEFWWGNEFIHTLTSSSRSGYMLRIEMEDWEGQRISPQYAHFHIESESLNYSLSLSVYNGSGSDSMPSGYLPHFTTYDHWIESNNTCGSIYGGGWWFEECKESNLNGVYRSEPLGHNYNGIIWDGWLGDYSLKSAKMMVRPFQFITHNSSSTRREPVDL